MKTFISRFVCLNLLLCVLLPVYLKAQNCPAGYENKNFAKQIKKAYPDDIISVNTCKQIKGSEIIQKVFFTIKNNTKDQLNIWLRFGIECKDAHVEYVAEDSMLKTLSPMEEISGYGDNADAELYKEINQDVSPDANKIDDITLEIFSVYKVVDGKEELVPSVNQQKIIDQNPAVEKPVEQKEMQDKPKEEPKKEPEIIKRVEPPVPAQAADKKKKVTTFARDENFRKGYLGLGMGLSFPLGSFANKVEIPIDSGAGFAKTGYSLNLSFAYRFGSHFGLSGLIVKNTYGIETDVLEEIIPVTQYSLKSTSWKNFNFLAGLYYNSGSSNAFFEMRLMAGYCTANSPEITTETDSYFGTNTFTVIESESGKGIGFDFGLGLKTSSNKPVCFILNLDYFSTSINFVESRQMIKALNFSLTLAYNLK